jgi:hypothetical protein
VEEAKRHFQAGVALYNEGNYSAALAEFEASYRANPTPALYYNIGLTQKALFRYADAIATLEKYAREEKKLSRERRTEVEQLVADMRLLLADVTLYVVPDGAQVVLDGRTIGVAPVKPLGIPAGAHVLEASADGYKPARKEIQVSAGVPMAIEIKLVAIPRTGKVHITASQPLARVRIDGRDYGPAPVDAELGLGGHQLEIAAVGFQTHRGELVVAGGQSRDLHITLEAPPPASAAAGPPKFYERWWFWAAVGAVVVGGTAVGVAAGSSTQDPIHGTLDPGAQRVN